MFDYEIILNRKVLGAITTQYTPEAIQKFFEKYQDSVTEINLNGFIRWLRENYDEYAEEFTFDGKIVL